MYRIKNSIFLELTKNQKADFLAFVKIFTKNHTNLDAQNILYNLLDELEYYRKLGQGKFEYIDINAEKNIEDIKKYITACKKYFEYKASLKPIYEENKRIQKEIKAKILDAKQKKEPPTKKQISYYKSLCKRHSEPQKSIEELSKYDVKIEIQRIIEKYSDDVMTVGFSQKDVQTQN